MKSTAVLWIAALLIVQANFVHSQNRTSIARVFESFWNIFDPTPNPTSRNPIAAGVNRLDEFTKQAVDYGIVTFTRVLSPFLQRLEQNASGSNPAAANKPNDSMTTTTTTEEPRSRRDAGLFEDIVQNLEPSEEILAKSINVTSNSETVTPGSSSKWAMRIRNYRRNAASSSSKTSGASAAAESWMAVVTVTAVTGWILAVKKC